MALERALSPQAFPAAQRRGVSEKLWENAKPLCTVPLLWLHEIILGTGSVDLFSSILREFNFKEFSLYRKQKGGMLCVAPLPSE